MNKCEQVQINKTVKQQRNGVSVWIKEGEKTALFVKKEGVVESVLQGNHMAQNEDKDSIFIC